jgi:ABC-type branched-subunit amino acid transport system substrate-binding protein
MKISSVLTVTLVLCVLSVLSPPAFAADEILLGMSTPLSGPTAQLGTAMRDGVLLGLERANREGGVHDRRLRLIVLDDGYEPTRTAPNMRRLIEEEEVLAAIGNVGTPTAIASLPLVRKHDIPFMAPFSGAGVLRQAPPEKYVFNFRASYAEEIAAMVDALILHGGLKPREIAFFTQRDGYGDAGYTGGFAALKRHGLTDERKVLHVRYPRNTLAVENALADILLTEKSPRAVIMVGAYAPCAKFIRLARQSGLHALFLSVSFVGGEFLAEELGADGDDVLVTQVVPHPLTGTARIVREYRTDLKSSGGSAPGYVGLEGYIAARLLTEALKASEDPPSREGVVAALEGLGTFDLGLGLPLRLDSDEHQASHHVWATRLENGALLPFRWEDIGTLLRRNSR